MLIFLFIRVDCSVPVPIVQYPATKETNDQQLQGILVDVSLAFGPCGKPNGSYEFQYGKLGHINFPNNGAIDVLQSGSITVLCWLLHFSQRVGSYLLIYSKSNKNQNNWLVRIHMKDAKLYATFTKSSSPQELDMKNKVNHWHHVGASYDNVTGNASLRVNGTIVAQKNIGSGWTLPTSGERKHIVSGIYFKGRITAIQVYNYFLTGKQIDSVKYATFGTGKNGNALFHLFDFLA